MNRRAFLSALACAGAVRLAGHAAAPSGRPPNILLLYTDDQTFDSIRALGNSEIRTPNLDRLAAAGTVFTNCYNQGAWHGAVCVASRTMLTTGRFLWEACAIEKQLKDEAERQRLWPQLMRQAGYRTCMTGKWHVSGVTPAQVFEDARHVRGGMPATCEEAYERPRADGSDPWQPWDTSRDGHWAGGKHWSEVTADDAIAFLQAPQPRDPRPFFIYAAFNAPHDPRQSPREMVQAYPPEQLALPPNFMPAHPHKDVIGCPHTLRDERLAPDPRTPHTVRVHRAEYYALVTWLDAQIGRVLDAVDAAGHAPDTAWPDRLLFTHVGRWAPGSAPDAAQYKTCAVRTARYRFVNHTELYDMTADRKQTRNIAAEHPDEVARLRAAYDDWWASVRPHLENEAPHDVPLQNPYKTAYWQQFGF